MGRSKQPRRDQSAINVKVSTTDYLYGERVKYAWGAEYAAPDHDVYVTKFGRGFDSTDRGRTGIYGVDVPLGLGAESNYPDMDSNLQVSDTADMLTIDP